jgi:VIT1/CCC1 family predicted Fe2+/Mn2+ transporter
MALTFVGAVSATNSGESQIREMLIAAFGCNIAWGLVDAVMYLVRTVADRGRFLTLVRAVQSAADPDAGRRIIEESMSRVARGLLSRAEIETIRGRLLAITVLPERPRLKRGDALSALAIFFIVVASTVPLVAPFLLIHDVGTAKNVSRAVALAMLFMGGLALGRYAGYGSWRVGIMMAGLGSVLVVAINALGG